MSKRRRSKPDVAHQRSVQLPAAPPVAPPVPASSALDKDQERQYFLKHYEAPVAFYKLLEMRAKKSPLFLPRTLSYRRVSRVAWWSPVDESLRSNIGGGAANAEPMTKLKRVTKRAEGGKLRRNKDLLPKFATLQLAGFFERAVSEKRKKPGPSPSPSGPLSRSPSRSSTQSPPMEEVRKEESDADRGPAPPISRVGRIHSIPLTVGLYEEHSSVAINDDSSTTGTYYTLLESHVIALPYRSGAKVEDTPSYPVELALDLASYAQSGRRVFVAFHVYNPSVLKNDAWFFGVTDVAAQTSAPPDNMIVRAIHSANLFQRGQVATVLPVKDEGRGSRKKATEVNNRGILVAQCVPAKTLPAHRPTRKQLEAVQVHEDGALPPVAAFFALFELVVVKTKGSGVAFSLARAGDHKHVLQPTDSKYAQTNHPLSRPSLIFKLEWECQGIRMRTLPQGLGRYRRVCTDAELYRRLTGIPPVLPGAPSVTWVYSYAGDHADDLFAAARSVFIPASPLSPKQARQRCEIRDDFCCPFCQLYCSDLPALVCHVVSSHDRFHFKCSGTTERPVITVVPVSLLSTMSQATATTGGRVSSGLRAKATVSTRQTRQNTNHFFSRRIHRVSRLVRAMDREANAQNQGNEPASSAMASSDEIRQDVEEPEFWEYEETAHLHFRRYFHSKSSQPMMDPVNAPDSDDDVDEDWILEQNDRLLDEFEDVSVEEKQFMKMWNHYIFYNKVYADRLLPQTSMAFAKAHARDIIQMGLRDNFLMHMINMWDYALITSDVISDCMVCVDKVGVEMNAAGDTGKADGQPGQDKSAKRAKQDTAKSPKKVGRGVTSVLRKTMGTLYGTVLPKQ